MAPSVFPLQVPGYPPELPPTPPRPVSLQLHSGRCSSSHLHSPRRGPGPGLSHKLCPHFSSGYIKAQTEGRQFLDLRFPNSASAGGGRLESNPRKQYLKAPGRSLHVCACVCTRLPEAHTPGEMPATDLSGQKRKGDWRREAPARDSSPNTFLAEENYQFTLNVLRTTHPSPSGPITLSGSHLPSPTVYCQPSSQRDPIKPK